jgi:hypothetical protein
MGFNPRLVARLCVLFASLALAAWLITRPNLRAVTLVVGAVVAIQVALLIRFVDRASSAPSAAATSPTRSPSPSWGRASAGSGGRSMTSCAASAKRAWPARRGAATWRR